MDITYFRPFRNGFVLGWSGDRGHGEYTFTRNGDKFTCDNECTNRESVREVLAAFADYFHLEDDDQPPVKEFDSEWEKSLYGGPFDEWAPLHANVCPNCKKGRGEYSRSIEEAGTIVNILKCETCGHEDDCGLFQSFWVLEGKE